MHRSDASAPVRIELSTREGGCEWRLLGHDAISLAAGTEPTPDLGLQAARRALDQALAEAPGESPREAARRGSLYRTLLLTHSDRSPRARAGRSSTARLLAGRRGEA